MTAYVLVDVEVTDPARYARYKDMAKPVVEAFGGKYLARAGRTDTLEAGDPGIPQRGAGARLAELARVPRSARAAPCDGEDEDGGD